MPVHIFILYIYLRSCTCVSWPSFPLYRLLMKLSSETGERHQQVGVMINKQQTILYIASFTVTAVVIIVVVAMSISASTKPMSPSSLSPSSQEVNIDGDYDDGDYDGPCVADGMNASLI